MKLKDNNGWVFNQIINKNNGWVRTTWQDVPVSDMFNILEVFFFFKIKKKHSSKILNMSEEIHVDHGHTVSTHQYFST